MTISQYLVPYRLDTAQLFRMPWTNSDNAFSWLEITRRCDLTCGYCYQSNDLHSDKDISQVEKEIRTLTGLRKCDAMIISGGEPLLHPRLEKIVRMVRAFKVKHKVCTNTFIPVRVPGEQDPWDLYVHGKKIDFKDTVFPQKEYKNPSNINLSAQDIYAQVRKALPMFGGNAFLGGTEVINAPKWFFGNILGTEKQVFGHLGPKTMEILQNGYHLIKDRFLSFLKPTYYARGKLLFAAGLVDKELRRAFVSYLKAVCKNPLYMFKKVSIQSLLILQPQDVLWSGKQDLCDGCPNRTYHKGRLVPMCRKEEYIRFGDMVTLKKRDTGNRADIRHLPAKQVV